MSEEQVRPDFDRRVATALRGAGASGTGVSLFIVALVLLAPPIAAVAVFVWLWLSRTELKLVGLVRPDNWAWVLVLGVAAGVVSKLLLKAVVMPYLGAPPTNAMLAPLAGNLQATLVEIAEVIVLAGFAEEIVFRGFLFHRLQVLYGSSVGARIFMVLGGGLFFGSLHWFGQGYFGAVNATIMGVIFGTLYFLNGQRLWFLIIMHAGFDAFAVWLTYAGLEEQVARSVFG
ncbi:MAG: type II CAAX endopeptidase family protein [Micropepsaceae bacterium]